MDNKAVKEIQAKMKTWTDAGIELAYNSGYEQGCKDRDEIYTDDKEDYNRGLNDAWECVKKIDDIPLDDLRPLLSTDDIGWIAKHYSASEAIAKIKEYKDKQTEEEIKIGDEIVYKLDDKLRMVVVRVDKNREMYQEDDATFTAISPQGFGYEDKIRLMKKTGRHFPQVAEILEQMKEKQND